MKNNNLLYGGIAVVVVILLVYLFSSSVYEQDILNDIASTTQKDINKNNGVVTKTTVKPAPAPIVGMKTSLGGIFAEKGSYQCDYESVTQQSRTKNVVYISDGKMRGEFRTSGALSSKSTIVVYDGSYLYLWTEGMSTGNITEPKTLADLPGIIPEDVASGRILGSGLNSVSWNCHAWSKVPSMLVKPSYVKFN